ncbi:serine proteinase stubble-like isoform X1 [Hylaeus anthracinus]|uniref:serine proteinase stubble-like isoform X1 n=1 Tax=Hylaeus volcanicus TaxID=313075 RepID=UPI0023B84371|nr:serine proteinase stubble-like isoform X1 [Hylaeus volcanicus]XP_053996400.1 serine proteinase stubble-like isoform X1 [Hylaeus anthracinus]
MGTARWCQWLLIGIVLIVSSSRTTSQTEVSGTSPGKPETNFSPSIVEAQNDNENKTDLALNSARRRRYVRFPTGPAGYLFEGGGPPIGRNIGVPPNVRFPSWRQHKSVWRSPVSEYNRPVMAHRTPRLIFRDNDFPSPVGGSAPSFFQQSNHLPDFEDDARDHRKQTLDDYPRLESGCGIPASKQTAQRRIVGGDEAGFGSFPWQAYIRIGSSRCGGTLVNRFHVVTAGHCVAKASARQVQVTLGDYVVNSASETLPAYTFGVREIRVHPYFKFTPQADRFDVAVLRLDRPVHYMPHIAPICLPEKNDDFLGQYGWAAGWGALQAGSRLRPKTLQAVDVPVIDNRVCERWHRSNGINVVIYDEMMCAGYRSGGKDSCQGDSGGPLMLEKTGRWYLIGIVSAGYSCAQPGQPGIYHRVAKTVDWITYVINS